MNTKMIILFLLYCVSSAFAWLPPERCAQGQFRARRSEPDTKTVDVTSNIEQVVSDQQKFLKQEYANYEFLAKTVFDLHVNTDGSAMSINAPHNCSFFTHKPRILAPFTCHSTPNCKLSHTVSNINSYTASEGYNWGAKISTKLTVVEKIFEVGGEVSTGGTYSCAYTKGKTTTTTVDCSTNKPGRLLLYLVSSDLKCDMGKISFVADKRSTNGAEVTNVLLDTTADDRDNIVIHSMAKYAMDGPYDAGFFRYGWVMIDPDTIPSQLYKKLRQQAPHFNPYTDLVNFDFDYELRVRIYYFKRTTESMESSVILPLTNAYGDAVFEYVCQFTPF